jgi:hypothetical protein
MELKKYTVTTIKDEMVFIGEYLWSMELSKPDWVGYETADGTFIRFKKEHIVWISEAEYTEEACKEK